MSGKLVNAAISGTHRHFEANAWVLLLVTIDRSLLDGRESRPTDQVMSRKSRTCAHETAHTFRKCSSREQLQSYKA